jgi:hypothetical protein
MTNASSAFIVTITGKTRIIGYCKNAVGAMGAIIKETYY